MAAHRQPDRCNFQQIKAQLDPCCTYMVFERPTTVLDLLEFPEVGKLLDPYRGQIIEQSLYYDDASERLFMVVKLEPQQMQGLENIVLHPGLPRDVVVYFYGNLPSQ